MAACSESRWLSVGGASVTVAAANSTSYVVLRSVTGIGGVLKSLGVAGGTDYHFVRVTLDGKQLVDDYLSGTLSDPSHSNTCMSLDLGFEQSMLVEVRDAARSPATKYWCVDVPHGSRLVESSEETVEIGGDLLRYRNERFATDEGGEYVSQRLLGPERTARVQLQRDVVLGRGVVAGVVRLEDFSGRSLTAATVDLLIRLSGTITALGTSRLGPVEGERAFELNLEQALEGPLNYLFFRGPPFPSPLISLDVVTDLAGYANFPARLSYAPRW